MNILNKLTIKHLTMNKKRTVVTIIGVMLSTALMVGIGLLLSTFREMMITETIEANGNYHVAFKDVSEKETTIIKNNSNVDYFYTSTFQGYALLDNNEYTYKPYIKIVGADKNYLKELNLVKGEMPQNSNEIIIPTHLKNLTGIEYKIGDTLTINLGDRILDKEKIFLDYYEDAEEFILNGDVVSYKIVGIVERSRYEDYSDPAFNFFTLNDLNDNQTIYVRYKNPHKAYEITETLAKTLGLKNTCGENLTCYEKVDYNDSLLSMYGASRYYNVSNSLGLILAIILSVISLGCIIVIYNSFAISVMERKKQFGLFSSIGATKSQIRKTVFFEALIISVIGIPLGILSAYIGIGIVILIMNNLLADMVNVDFKLCTYAIFIIIPILFMLITIFISAFIPAKKASKITPIEAIRLNDDIKIKNKKLKTNKLVKKIFGLEGELALKNIKRNKKKYLITIASLFISVVMFVSFAGFMDYAFKSTEEYMTMPQFDFSFAYVKNNTEDNMVHSLISNEHVTEYTKMSLYYDYALEKPLNSMYSSKMQEYLKDFANINDTSIMIIVIDNDNYASYLKKAGYSKDKPVLYNYYHGIEYINGARVSKNFERYNKNFKETLNIVTYNYETENTFDTVYSLKDYYISKESLLATDLYEGSEQPILLMSENYFEKNFNREISDFEVLVKVDDVKAYAKFTDNLMKENTENKIIVYNMAEQFQMVKNLVLMIQILVYGFIALVTLIGVTSVFNTINTSIALRRKEFAMLRSMGLTPKGFNKMLYFESLFVGLKALLYGLPFAFIIILALHRAMSGMVEFDGIIIPYKSILIAILGVFMITIITMMYASSKIKHENILEAIREENI